jgi:hypothetical protein
MLIVRSALIKCPEIKTEESESQQRMLPAKIKNNIFRFCSVYGIAESHSFKFSSRKRFSQD